MRRFVLARHEDITGLSGTGIIAEGVAWTGGPAFLHWLTDYEAFVQWPGGIDAILAVHGHQGATVVRWIDELAPDPQPPTTGSAWEAFSPPLNNDYPDHDAHDPRD
jgi:hypothetical protein